MKEEKKAKLNKDDKKERALILAERVKLLFGFCADLIPDKELLEEVMNLSGKRTSDVLSMAPILGAFGQDYKEVHFEAEVKARRAKALYDLINTLDETEKEREEFRKKQESKQAGLETIKKILGA